MAEVERIKPTPRQGTTASYYVETEWQTGDIITQPKMMNIEDWLASATDELIQARYGKYVNGTVNYTGWDTIGKRIDYLTRNIQLVIPEGAQSLIDDIDEAIENVETATSNAEAATARANTSADNADAATERANKAAVSIEDMTVAAQTLAAGQAASIISWQKVDDHWALTLGIPVTNFTTSTTTTYDGTTEAKVTIDNNTSSLTRNLAFSIPVPKFNISTETVKTGSIAAAVEATDTTTLNPKLKFKIPIQTYSLDTTVTKTSGDIAAKVETLNTDTLTPKLKFTIPVVKPEVGTVTTKNTGAIVATDIVKLSDTTTLTPKLNFEIPVQQIKDVEYARATPGEEGDFEIQNADKLDPTLKLTMPVQNIKEVSATQLNPGVAPTAALESIDDLNLRLKLGLPLAKPIDVVKTYPSILALESNIANDVAVGYYAIVAGSVNDQDNGRIYIRTETAPYYSFVADIAAATPTFQIGDVNVLDATGTKSASIDISDPENPVLNLNIPAVPVFNSTVDVTTIDADQDASATLSGPATDKKLSLSVPRGAIPNFSIGTVTTGAPGSDASATITGSAASPILNLTIPCGNTGSIENLTPATTEEIGGIIVGDYLSVDNLGTISPIVYAYDVTIPTTAWSNNSGTFTYTVSNVEHVNAQTDCRVKMDDSYFELQESLIVETLDDGVITFKTNKKPIGQLNITLILQQVG